MDSSDWQFINSCAVYLFIDGKRSEYACEVTRARADSLAREVYVTENLRVKIPADDYKAMLTAKLVEMRVGVYEFRLKDKHIKEFKKVDIAEITTSQ